MNKFILVALLAILAVSAAFMPAYGGSRSTQAWRNYLLRRDEEDDEESDFWFAPIAFNLIKNKLKRDAAFEEESDLDFAEDDEEDEEESDAESGQSINQAGLNLIKHAEGWRSCVYKDAVGYPTIGYGHLIKKGEHFKCITPAEGEKLLRKDVASFESCVSRSVKVPITSNQFSALVSFAFNLGCGNLQSSTLLKKVNAKASKAAVCTEFKKWVKAGGRTLPGLVTRRANECKLYSS